MPRMEAMAGGDSLPADRQAGSPTRTLWLRKKYNLI